jgi:tripartite-type tricarboxylate transporter receptor subunit TctC
VPGYEYTTWYGIFAPAKTPRTLIARLNAEIVKAMETPDIKDRFTALGGDPDPGTPEELRAIWRTNRRSGRKSSRPPTSASSS